MQFKDYYKIMGVAPEATPDQIKAAYRTLARKYHPDVNKEKDAQKKFTDLGEAYEALGDPAKRTAYDELRGQGWKEGQDFHAPPQGAHRQQYEYRNAPGGAAGEEMSSEDFSDFFSAMFGTRAGHGRRTREAFQERGEDIHYRIELTLAEAFSGGERDLRLSLPGENAAGTSRVLHVTIPKGLKSGEHIRLRGQGMPGPTAELSGNLYLEVTLTPHPYFHLDGNQVLLDLPIAPWEAVLGGPVATPTLSGVVELNIPANSQDGQTLRLRGRGWPGNPPGDQLVRLRIGVPPTSSDEAKGLWRQLAKESSFNPRTKLGV